MGLSDRLSPHDLPPVEVLVEDLSAVLERTGRLLRRHFGETRVAINRISPADATSIPSTSEQKCRTTAGMGLAFIA